LQTASNSTMEGERERERECVCVYPVRVGGQEVFENSEQFHNIHHVHQFDKQLDQQLHARSVLVRGHVVR
jgi:hypothetical protein